MRFLDLESEVAKAVQDRYVPAIIEQLDKSASFTQEEFPTVNSTTNSPTCERPNTSKSGHMLLSNEKFHALLDRFMSINTRVSKQEEVNKITKNRDERISFMEGEQGTKNPIDEEWRNYSLTSLKHSKESFLHAMKGIFIQIFALYIRGRPTSSSPTCSTPQRYVAITNTITQPIIQDFRTDLCHLDTRMTNFQFSYTFIRRTHKGGAEQQNSQGVGELPSVGLNLLLPPHKRDEGTLGNNDADRVSPTRTTTP